MKFNLNFVATLAVVGLTCVVSAAAYYYKSRNSEINEVMIFCKLQYNPYNYFDKLVSFIEAAKKSVNVCMPGIHNPAIQGRLLQLIKSKNIKLRLVIDRDGFRESSEVFIQELINAGAEIKYKFYDPIHKMQHKFCLVDDKILMTGTLDWGDDLTSDHWNYVYITNKTKLVQPVKKEFYNMWNMFSGEKPVMENIYKPQNDSNSDTIDFFKSKELVLKLLNENDDSETVSLRASQKTPEVFIDKCVY